MSEIGCVVRRLVIVGDYRSEIVFGSHLTNVLENYRSLALTIFVAQEIIGRRL